MIEILIAAVAGFVGWKLHRAFVKFDIRSRTHPPDPDNTVNVILAKDGEMYYIYEAKTGWFLAQGKTQDEVAQHLYSRFPTKVFVASQSEIEKVGYLN